MAMNRRLDDATDAHAARGGRAARNRHRASSATSPAGLLLPSGVVVYALFTK
jgi:hypothetical protein